MEFKTPLIRGHLLKRYKRFLADIQLEEGGFITAHCPNSGAMQGLSDPGTPVWVSHSPNPARKLPYTWEMAEVNSTYVGTNTSHPNFLVTEALQLGLIPELRGFGELKREVSYGKNSRIDILLTHSSAQLTYVEVKNVHLKRDNKAAFPSSVTTRGAKHMRELVDMVEAGHQAYIIYVVQRNDCSAFEIAGDIDPHYQEETLKAFKRGVKPLVYACDVSPKGITLTHSLTFNYE
ncbi:DNA/RNA nuclease SfsA [Geitlerinema splendidum]|jgi:sugar fermentation stimulation protein A|nr:DNA/RNA nuclease SfsA [Geitlerinema splendidum]